MLGYPPYHHLASEEGGDVAMIKQGDLGTCKELCDDMEGCQSFAICSGSKCWLKNRTLTGNEPTTLNSHCQTYYAVQVKS